MRKQNRMQTNISSNILTCHIKTYSQNDKEVFREWLKKIDCIDSFEGTYDELSIEISVDDPHDHNLRDLLGLFCRYDIEMLQLKLFLTEENKHWFCNKNAYWIQKVFGNDTPHEQSIKDA